MKLNTEEKKVRILFSISLAIVIVVFALFFFRSTDTLDDEFKYQIDEAGYVTVKGFTGNPKTLTIPSEIEGKPVRYIDREAFGGHYSALEKVVIPEGVEVIGEKAFADAPKLKTVELPSTLREIGHGAFMNCSYLKNIDLPDGIIVLGDNAFDSCVRLHHLKVPSSVTVIGHDCFLSCESLILDVSDNPTAAAVAEAYRIETGTVDSFTLYLLLSVGLSVLAVAAVFVGMMLIGKRIRKKREDASDET